MSQNERMRAAVLSRIGALPEMETVAVPTPGEGEVLLAVEACAVCRTDLHIQDGDLEAGLPLIMGHQIVGRVVSNGPGTSSASGTRLGVPWLGSTCGVCQYCLSGRENLCDAPTFTGCDRDGGYAEYVTAREAFCFALPEGDPAPLAPLLCGGLIGYRALTRAGTGEPLGLYGFGSSAHLLAQALSFQGREYFAFTRPGDVDGQRFARDLGAAWSGGSDTAPPAPMAAAVIFAPVGGLMIEALRHVKKGGRIVSAGIHMSDIPKFPYRLLWGERVITSVANLTRQDGDEFLRLAAEAGIEARITRYSLDETPAALDDLRSGRIEGSAVVVMQRGD